MRPSFSIILLLCLSTSLLAATDASRRTQVASATTNAIDAIDHEIGNQSLGSSGTIKDFLQRTHSDTALRDWLGKSLPIGGPRWLDDQTCQVRIQIDGDKLADWLTSVAKKNVDISSSDADSLAHSLDDLRTHGFEATSTSAAVDQINGSVPTASTPGNIAATSAPSSMIPAQPPAWIDQQLDAVGHGFVSGSQLRSAHAAEHDAVLKLRTQLGMLHLDDSHTVLDAAAHDPHVADAINQTLEQARPYKSEFNADGSVTTHEILDLHDFWQALASAQ